MDIEKSEIVLAMSKKFIDFLLANYGGDWVEGYFRFYLKPTENGMNGSVKKIDSINLIGVFKFNAFYDDMEELSEKLFKSLSQKEGVILLSVNSEYDFDLKFNFDDTNKWEISKLNDGKGVPLGF